MLHMERNSVLHFDLTTLTKESEWTRSVNLMCHILNGVDYQTLYGDKILKQSGGGRHLFDRLLRNATNLPKKLLVDADGIDYPEIESVLTGAFGDIKTMIEAYPDYEIELGEFFFTPRVEQPEPGSIDEVKNYMIDRLDYIHDSTDGKMRHFCTPFVEIQKGRASYSTQDEMQAFLDVLGNKSLTQFHTLPRTTYAQAVAVKRANDAGILRIKPLPDAVQAKVHEGNGKHCCNGNCVPSEDPLTWCVQVVHQGISYCALGSDYDPNCQ